MAETLISLRDQGIIQSLDYHLALFLEQQQAKEQEAPDLALAAALTSAAVRDGHVCWPLDAVESLGLPQPPQWRQRLLATAVVGEPGEIAPLILDQHNRLYLYRFHCCEDMLAQKILARAARNRSLDTAQAQPLLARLFPPRAGNEPDLQQAAAALALLKPLVIISGGPGTGKTYTVARILALLQALHPGPSPLRLALAAPTGKAAVRLEESIRKAKQAIPPDIAAAVPEQAQTLHRLLGFLPHSPNFRHNQENPLPLDLLVLDEASMIDVMMMEALLQALPEQAQLILLGDRSQLASVEAGSLFADLCGSGDMGWSTSCCQQMQDLIGFPFSPGLFPLSPLADSFLLLRTGHRFQKGSGIAALAEAVNRGAWQAVEEVLEQDFPDLFWIQHCGPERELWLREAILQGFQNMVGASSVEEAFAAMEQFRLLCTVNKGPNGTEGINDLAHLVLLRAGLLERDSEWYQGRPLLILRNHYGMQLFNGDTGLLWRDSKGQLRAWFRRSHGELYALSPALLPEHSTAYAMTIHKSQGSEFQRVLLLLPEEDNKVLRRELLYTGITRAQNSLTLCADRNILRSTLALPTQRYSGLGEKLHTC
jgi:exodeoxyribonuclease V alpha subunit